MKFFNIKIFLIYGKINDTNTKRFTSGVLLIMKILSVQLSNLACMHSLILILIQFVVLQFLQLDILYSRIFTCWKIFERYVYHWLLP